MNAFVRSSISCAIAVAGVSALVSVPAPAQERQAAIRQPAVVLTAQVQPLGDADRRSALQPLDTGRRAGEFPRRPVRGLHRHRCTTRGQAGRDSAARCSRTSSNGTPLPVALSRAVRTFAEIELDAGRELVGFAAQYIDFQVRFIAKVLRAAVAVATAIPVAVGELVTSTVSHFTPAPATGPDEAPSVRAAQAEVTAADTGTVENDAPANSKAASSSRSIESTWTQTTRRRSALRAKSEATPRQTRPMSTRQSRRRPTTATPLVRRTPASPRKRQRPKTFRKLTTSSTTM